MFDVTTGEIIGRIEVARSGSSGRPGTVGMAWPRFRWWSLVGLDRVVGAAAVG